MWPFKKNPYKCKYVEITWEYPVPEGVPMTYKYRFTNKPHIHDTSTGNLGKGMLCFNMDNISDINKFARLNYGYKKQNYNHEYIPNEIIKQVVDIHNQRRLNNL